MAKHTVVTDLRFAVLQVLKEERKRQKKSQTVIAEITGISKTTILNMESLEYNGSLDFTLAYMQALNIDFTQIQNLINQKFKDIKTPVINH